MKLVLANFFNTLVETAIFTVFLIIIISVISGIRLAYQAVRWYNRDEIDNWKAKDKYLRNKYSKLVGTKVKWNAVSLDEKSKGTEYERKVLQIIVHIPLKKTDKWKVEQELESIIWLSSSTNVHIYEISDKDLEKEMDIQSKKNK